VTQPHRAGTPGDFLHALGQALSAMSLYGAAHPSRGAARKRAHERLQALLATHAPLRITWLDGDMIVDRTVLHEFRGWEWGQKLAAAGVQRIEFEQPSVDEATFAAWLEAVHAAVSPGGAAIGQSTLLGPIRFGPVALSGDRAAEGNTADGGDGGSDPRAADGLAADPALAESEVPALSGGPFGGGPFGGGPIDGGPLAAWRPEALRPDALRDELEALTWVEERVASTSQVPASEVEAIIRGLSLAMQAEHGSLLPLIALKSADQYTTVHACNVAMLSMGLAELLAFSSRDVRTIGVAALLHDIGKVRLPEAILTKPAALTPEEREIMWSHTTEGARLLGERGSGYGLAAIVAYEHHMWANGQGGYPGFRFQRTPHYVSRLVQVCDVYDALSTDRPYRAGWPRARTLHHMRLQAGRELDYELLMAFFDLLDRAEKRQALPL